METLPSSQIVDIDIPNYEDQFNVQFVYNFFVEDEIDASFYRNMFLAGFFSLLII